MFAGKQQTIDHDTCPSLPPFPIGHLAPELVVVSQARRQSRTTAAMAACSSTERPAFSRTLWINWPNIRSRTPWKYLLYKIGLVRPPVQVSRAEKPA